MDQAAELAVDKLVTGGRQARDRRWPLLAATTRQRDPTGDPELAMVQKQIAEIKRERDTASTACEATERKRDLLSQLKSVGPAISAFLSREVYYRPFANKRQVGSFLGLTPSPYDSGEEERCQGISRAGSSHARAVVRKLAIALWRYVELGLVPQGAILNPPSIHLTGEASALRLPDCAYSGVLKSGVARTFWKSSGGRPRGCKRD